jgi:hypothetical protein
MSSCINQFERNSHIYIPCANRNARKKEAKKKKKKKVKEEKVGEKKRYKKAGRGRFPHVYFLYKREQISSKEDAHTSIPFIKVHISS